ncbi:type II secretion system F family protein [Cellulomonas soli]|uniref:type II secretion system F family protein n=1 Tax=Cellulomonas soli TaxID=931535 RepID=UPI003F8269DB
MTPLVCLVLGLAVLAACGPPSRRPHLGGVGRARSAVPRRASGVRTRWRPRTRRHDLDLTALLAQVAAQVRAGAAPRAAWAQAIGTPSVGAVPTLTELLGAQTGRSSAGLAGRAAAALAASRLADDLGAPLAELLDRVGDALATEAELESDRRTALAGPRSTATVLSWLPALGLVLGTGLGANPLGVLLGGGVGTAAGVLGLAALLAGRAWTRALLARAARPARVGRR